MKNTYGLYSLDGGHIGEFNSIKECHDAAKGFIDDYIVEVYLHDLENMETRIYSKGKLIQKTKREV